MDIQKELNAFKAVAQSKGWNTDGEKTQTNYHFYCLTTNSGWEMWQAAKANATAYESCSVKSHEIIINETKNELIDSYDIAKEDEYLLEALVYRGVCIGNAQASAVPEGFVLVPKEPTQELYRTFYDAFNSANAGNTAQCFKVAYKAMIEAQEQSHE